MFLVLFFYVALAHAGEPDNTATTGHVSAQVSAVAPDLRTCLLHRGDSKFPECDGVEIIHEVNGSAVLVDSAYERQHQQAPQDVEPASGKPE